MEAEQAPPPSSSAPSSSSSAPSSSSCITDSVPTSSSPFSNVAPTSSASFSTTLVSATTTTMATSTATSDTTATVTTTTTTQMIDIPPILGATATTSTSTGETNSLTSTSISSSTTAPTAATTISTTTTTITTSPFSTFDHQPPSNALPLRPSFPINRNRPQMPPPIPPPHFAQHLPSPSPPPLPFSSSSPASSSSVGVPSLLASSSSSSSSLSSSSSSSSPSPPPSATSPSSSSSPLQRGGLAIGVPAYPPRPQSTSLLPSSTFGSPPFGHQLGSLGRISDQTQSASPQVRPGMQGIQTIGMMGALSGSQIRPGAAAAHLPPRPAQQQLRPQSPSSSQPSAPQKQQGPGLSRVSSFGPGNSQPPSMPHSPQSHTQPWMSTQGRSVPASVLSSASYRPQFRSSILQQRSTNTQQQQNPIAVAPQQQQQQQQQNVSSQQQQQQQQPQQQQQQQQPQQNTSQMQHAAENYPQMHQPSRMHPVLQPQQGLRPQGSVQKSIAPPSVPSAHHGSLASTKASEPVETGNQILSKRSIHELLAQIDPLERLDPEVEDVLAEIADDFVESITTFACSLAKHRKSTTLEAKDVLLHMERNWNMTLPGFSADEIKIFKKPPVNDIHKQRMVAIKKSYITTQAMAETANVKGSSGQVPGNVKGHPGKGPAMTSPKT